ncbi:MAG: hypothetical protein MR291_03260 [Oscillospiraceae bacterium]|nr:hypothetical protein [Oscillospiraceae bacterium]
MNMTISLAGSEVKAEYSGANAWLRNDGADVIYAAAKPGITAGADGVVAIPAGQSAPVYGANGAVWLTGTGSVQLIGSDYSTNPFKVSAQAGGSGADDVARAAISAHSGNAEIHVTAADKAAWNGKAELTDIPDKLPADGGNAETVGNLSAIELVRNLGRVADTAFLNNSEFNEYSYEADIEPTTADAIGLPTGWYIIKGFRFYGAGKYAVQIAYPRNRTDQAMTRYANGTDWTVWRGLGDGCNAASVGTYTEAKIAALEARIAALEGN